jgi:HD-GYP domain-containing protein (c-di-GMP phosphodiesterase class II)
MNNARLSGPDELFAAREEIAERLYENAPGGARTLILKLLTRSFADEYAGAIVENRAPAIVAWAEEMCAKPGRAAAVEHLFASAQTLEQYLIERGLPKRFVAQLPALGEIVRAVAGSDRSRQGFTDHLDEVDAAIAEHLAKLAAADPKAAAHARDVSSWCARLARRLVLSDREIEFASRAGSLHNIGGEEGASAGESMVTANPLLEPFASVIRSHRAVADGQTSIAARIVAVACRFNHVLAGDEHGTPTTPAAALERVISESGTRYDIVVVAALIDLVSGA